MTMNTMPSLKSFLLIGMFTPTILFSLFIIPIAIYRFNIGMTAVLLAYLCVFFLITALPGIIHSLLMRKYVFPKAKGKLVIILWGSIIGLLFSVVFVRFGYEVLLVGLLLGGTSSAALTSQLKVNKASNPTP
jgi:hypothetical protein